MATFEINRLKGTFDGETWTIDDPVLQNEVLPRMAATYEPDGYDPDRVNSVLKYVMDELGGRVIEKHPAETIDDEADRVYYKLREHSNL